MSANKTKRGRIFHIALSASFFAIISLPILNPRLPYLKRFANLERRTLNQKPDFTLKTLDRFPQDYEKYFNDNFGFRNLLIYWHSIIKIRYFGKSPMPQKVVIGKDGWLFYAGENALKNYQRTTFFTEEKLEKIRENLEKRIGLLKNKGIFYYVVFVPEKQTIYPEFMPDSVQRCGLYSKLDQVVNYLKKYPGIKVIDLRGELLRQKGTYLEYEKLGTHWNQFGAFIGYRELMKVIAQDFPSVSPLGLTDFSVGQEVREGGGLSDMLGLPRYFFKENIIKMVPKEKTLFKLLEGGIDQEKIEQVVITEVNNPRLPRLVVFRDSFATGMIPFISGHFSRSVYIWCNVPKMEVIEQEKPDIVVNEVEERYLSSLME